MTRTGFPTLGVFGPRAPYKSGVARYIEQSLSHLAHRFRCVHVGPNDHRHPEEFDQVLYHLGNDPLHAGVLRALLQRPGAVMLHDYHLTDLGEPFGHAAAVQRLVVEHATVLFVHNRDMAHLLTSRYPDTRVTVLPYPASPASGISVESARERFGLSHDVYVFAVLACRLGRYERLETVLESWRLWQNRPSDTVLVLAGGVEDGIVLPADASILPLGYVDYHDLDALMLACDCAVQLRDPLRGETLWPARQLAAHQRPLIGTDLPETGDLAFRDAITLIPSGPGESTYLFHAMSEHRGRPSRLPVFDHTTSWDAWRQAVLPRLPPKGGFATVSRHPPRPPQAVALGSMNFHPGFSDPQSELMHAVMRAGQRLLDVWPGNPAVDQTVSGVRSKPDGSPVSHADHDSQDILVAALQLTHPGAVVVSEEDECSHQNAGDALWFVDPLDGTSQYLVGSPDFAILLSSWTGGRPEFSTIHYPAHGLTAVAVGTSAAFRAVNGSPPGIPSVHAVYCDPPGLRRALPAGTRYLVDHAEATRILLDVACGHADGAVVRMCGQRAWDIAAPVHILQAARTLISDECGCPVAPDGARVDAMYLVAARTAALHTVLLDILNRHGEQATTPRQR